MNQHEFDEFSAYQDIQKEIDRQKAIELWRKAHDLDVELPAYAQEEMWVHSDDGQHTYLSHKGRTHVRKLIHEEHTRQFDLRYGYFIKIVIPFFGLLIALLGAYTGYLAVKQRGQSFKNIPAETEFFVPGRDD